MCTEFWRMGATPVPCAEMGRFAREFEASGWDGLAVGEAHGLLPDPYAVLSRFGRVRGRYVQLQSTPGVMGPAVRRDSENDYVDRCITGFSTGFLASLRLCAVLISAMWVSACGKFPV